MSTFERNWRQVMLPLNTTIDQAIRSLNEVSLRIILIIDNAGVLQGTISDGDIRRGLLKGLTLDSPVTTIIHRSALVVPPDLARALVIQLMRANKIHQIPIVDENNRVIGLHLWDEIMSTPKRPNLMVIMAGGIGIRMLPHTENCPKPMLNVAGKPILEHIIERAKLEGFSHFLLSVNYLAPMIKEYFGNGHSFGVQIEYLHESTPLGTGGALSLIKELPDNPFVVTNGDVITDIRYGEVLDFHIRHSATGTMAIRMHEWKNPFGVVQTQGVEIIGFEEKPITRSHINAGVYVLNPEAVNLMAVNEYCDMPTLFERLQARKNLIVAYPMHEPWLDVGRPEDLIAANKL
uniref:nucleotidyltransferase family protein n=1 Tax=Polynucleobacter sp. TaxID=2029855 RepID=UPI0040481495